MNVGQSPNAVWRKYKRGGYKWWNGTFNKPVRIGAYGDVAEIPDETLDTIRFFIRKYDQGHTCYTAQWRTRPDLQDIAMASVHTFEGWAEANDLGWSTFRVAEKVGYYANHKEVICPTEWNDSIQCDKCKLCCGNSKGQRSIYIPAHGPTAKRVHQNKGEK